MNIYSDKLKKLENNLNLLIEQGCDYNSKKVISVLKEISFEKSKLENQHKQNQSPNQVSSQKLAELENTYNNLINQGYDFNSKKIVSILKEISFEKSKLQQNLKSCSKKEHISNYSLKNNNYKKISNSYDFSRKNCHFIIDTLHGDYTLLDNNKVIDKVHSSPVTNFILRKRNYNKYKKTLRNDYKLYKKTCKNNNKKINKNIKKSIKKIKRYLWICPDADYTILYMLRKHIVKLNPSTKNYLYASESYLKELAHFNHGNAQNMPFDITLACTDGKTSNNHKYIAQCVFLTDNPVKDYINAYSKQPSHNEYINSQRSKINYKSYNPQNNNYNKSKIKYKSPIYGSR